MKKMLIAKEGRIYNNDRKFICSMPITDRGKELLNDEGWEKDNESWLNYRNRTKEERNDEELKRYQLANDIVFAYNKIFMIKDKKNDKNIFEKEL